MRFLLLLAAGIFLPLIAQAHLVGSSFEEVIDGYLIDIGYSPEYAEALGQTRLDFNLFEESTDEPVPFTDIWLRITKEGRTFFAGGIKRPTFGNTGVLYAFPEEGRYDISVRFQNDDKVIVENSFKFDVTASSSRTSSGASPSFLLLGGLVAGLISGFLLSSRFKK